MPRVAFSQENKVAQVNYDFPKLKLKQNERARILLGLEDPIVEYVHTLQKPKIENGEAVTMEQVNERTGARKTVNVMDFISRPLCLGDQTILSEKGSDTKNCPMCKLAKEHPDYTKPAQRRYAMHVLRYKTKNGSFDLVKPFMVETVVWSFTDTTFNKIVDFATEWGDLRKHDLLLGPCTNESYQKFDISVGSNAAWLDKSAPENKKHALEVFEENRIPDLTIACGSRKDKEWIEQDIQTIKDAWAEISGSSSVDLDEDLDLIQTTRRNKPAPEETFEKDEEGWAKSSGDEETDKLAAGLNLDDLDDDDSAAPEVAADEDDDLPPVKPAPTRKPAAKKPEPKEEPAADTADDFDDLLADINNS